MTAPSFKPGLAPEPVPFKAEGPQPLLREIPPGEPYPVETPFAPDAAALAGARIAELAKLKPLDYEMTRLAAAEALGMRVAALDREVIAARPRTPDDQQADPFEAVDPWGEQVNGAALLAEMQAAILRFCILPPHSAPLMAAWVLHAWAHDAADISPVLAFVSPEKRCGKTTALSIIGALVPKVMHTVNCSVSVLFRVVEMHRPTVLIDEADTFLGDNDELRGILNGGHNRISAYVWRSVGDDHEPRKFNVWAPKCIAMIGKLPDTLDDRALVVPLRRKQAGEVVERFQADRLAEFLPLRRKAARWAADNLMRLRDMDPDVPEALNDRAQDNARAICAISDMSGGIWPGLVRTALVGLAGQADDEPQSAGVLLLRDVNEIFETRITAQIGSTELCTALCALEESPWGEWRRGSPITTRGIAKLLKPFGVKPRQDRAGSKYWQADLADPLARYLSETSDLSATSAQVPQKPPRATGKINNINDVVDGGTCGGILGSAESKHHKSLNATAFEGEL